jgi:release factor glutamine methyltransferase
MSFTLTLAQALSNLQSKGLARLDAQLLLLHLLGLAEHQRGWLLAHDADPFPAELVAALNQLVVRRLAGEPLAYLTGKKEFYGLDLKVDARVLVPRPDTETLVDWALEALNVWPTRCPQVLDLGTGSGAIALALKASRPDWQVVAIDFSSDALEVARDNAQRLQLDVSFFQGAWFGGLTATSELFDCIVSNPPYIAAQDQHLADLTFEPKQALASGIDGLDDIRHIIQTAPKHLKPGAWLLLEHGYDQALAVRELLLASGFHSVQSRRDMAGIERCSGGQLLLNR